MGKIKDYLLEQQEKGMNLNESETTLSRTMDSTSSPAKGQTYDFWASPSSTSTEKVFKSSKNNSKNSASSRHRGGGFGLN
jgi:hypothetical protein